MKEEIEVNNKIGEDIVNDNNKIDRIINIG